MKETETYRLKKPEPNDFYNVEDFNHNADVIDAALMAHDGALTDIMGYIGYTAPDIYGVEVDFENNRFTRLAGAVGLSAGSDFDNLLPWKRRRCNVTHGGTVTAYYGDEGYTETGFTTTEITPGDNITTYPVGTPVNVMVEQPPFYYKVVPLKVESISSGFVTRKMRYYVSALPKDGFTLHPAFRSVRIPVYLAAYESCLYNTDTSKYESTMFDPDIAIDVTKHRLASVSGVNVILSDRTFTGTDDAAGTGARGYFQNMICNGYEIQRPVALAATQLLFLIEYASFNAQTNIGIGMTEPNMGGTGSTRNLGNASGTVPDGSVSYRGEENLWGHHWYTTMQPYAWGIGCKNGYISAFYYNLEGENLSQANSPRPLIGFGVNRAGDSLALFNVAETLGTSVQPVGDIYKTELAVLGLLTDRYVLHGGVNSEDDKTQSGLFARYYTPNNEGEADTPFTVRICLRWQLGDNMQ